MVFQAVVVDETELEQELPDIQGHTGEPLPVLSPKTLIGEHTEPVTVETIRVIENDTDGETGRISARHTRERASPESATRIESELCDRRHRG